MIELDSVQTVAFGGLALFAGYGLCRAIPLLRRYNLPEPVLGGLLVALLAWWAHSRGTPLFKLDTSLQSPLMIAFFTTIGVNASLRLLKVSGRQVAVFLVIASGFAVLQNLVGIAVAKLFGLHPMFGVLAGSATLTGGPATGLAFAPLFEAAGLKGAESIAVTAAMAGIVCGGLIGGPVARYLVKHSSSPDGTPDDQVAPTAFEKPDVGRVITSLVLIESIALIAICLTLGKVVAQLLAGSVFELPTFVCVLFIGVILSNSLALAGLYRVFDRAVSVLGNVSLSLFLAMALMSLKLWELASLALPMIIILAVQALAMALYAVFVTYRMMGKNYDAAVLAAGHCGFGLGATPTAIANMQAITDRFGPSHMAFLVVPMVGAFFIDIVNALVIKLYLLLPIFG